MSSDLHSSPVSSDLFPSPDLPDPIAEPSGAEAFTPEQHLGSSPHSPSPEGSEFTRQQPIPPPTEDKQYRAIGLIQGRYVPSEDQFTRGIVITEDGTELDAVLLGRVLHLVRHRLDLDQAHLWVVYPRTREREEQLHIQIMGVWAPEEMGQPIEPQPTTKTVPNYFSVRGEVVFQAKEGGFVIVKIRRAKPPQEEKGQTFNLRLEGQLPFKGVGRFWDLDVQRQGSRLQIESATAIDKPRPRLVDRSHRKRRPRSEFDPARPDSAQVARPQRRSSPLPKPILKGKQ